MKIVVTNKKARFQYHLLDSYEAGMELMGTEVKSLRLGGASLVDAYCKIENGELFLIDCNISQYSHGNFWNHDPRRKR
ncbi:MAG TPA: SsrA-binding protein, partial [Mesotoga infera]|nr:SsrA-binding protein [Mesotoga infera]